MHKTIEGILSFVRPLLKGQLAKSAAIYTIAKVIKSCIPFFMLPVMTSYLTPADYGTITMLTTVFAFLTPFVTLNMESALIRRYYYKNDNTAQYVGNTFMLSAASMVLVTIIFFFFGGKLSTLLAIPTLFIVISPFYCHLTLYSNSILSFWQVTKKPIKYGVYTVLQTFIEISIAILLIVGLGFNWQGRAISIMSTCALFAGISLIILLSKKMINLTVNKEMISHALKYGGGLIPHAIGATLIMMANRFFLTNMVSIEETGFYGVAYQFASIMMFITGSFNNAFVPWLFEKLSLNDNREKRKIVKFSYLYMFLLLIVGLLVFIFVWLIFPFFVKTQFDGALKYIPWLLLGAVFQGCYYMVTNYILYTEKTVVLALITISTGIVSVILNYFLIPLLGGIGAAVAYAVTFFLYFIATWIAASKVYKMPWNLKITEV